MIAWLVFVALTALSALAVGLFAPPVTRERYAQCRTPLVLLAHALSHSVWIVAAMQAWIAAPSLPVEAQTTGAVLLAAGRALLVWAMAVNPYFSPCVAKPVRIVREGPYYWLKHPAYCGLALAHIGTFLLLAQTWALIPLIPYLCLLAWRARVESRLLASLYKS